MKNRIKQQNKTEFELWKNIIPKNNGLKVSFQLKQREVDHLIQINQYSQTKNDFLGKGFQGEVYKVQNHQDNKQYACKIFKRSKLKTEVKINYEQIKIEEFVIKELAAAKILSNEHLAIAQEVIDDNRADNVQLIIELCEGEICYFDNNSQRFNNEQFLENYTINKIYQKKCLNQLKLKKVFKQLIEGVFYLHNLNLAHCDIKPQNVMKKDGNVKLVDFGSLAQTQIDPSNNMKSSYDNGYGTPQFQAPEYFITDDKTNIDKCKLDIWALGQTFFIQSFGFLPFEIEFDSGYVVPKSYKIQWEVVDENQQFTHELKDFIEYILNYDPVIRPTIYELIDHEYLRDESNPQNNINFCNSQQSNGNYFDFTNLFFKLQGLNADEMVVESDSVQGKKTELPLSKKKIFKMKIQSNRDQLKLNRDQLKMNQIKFKIKHMININIPILINQAIQLNQINNQIVKQVIVFHYHQIQNQQILIKKKINIIIIQRIKLINQLVRIINIKLIKKPRNQYWNHKIKKYVKIILNITKVVVLVIV